MTTSQARGLATAADIADEWQEVVNGEIVWKASPTFDHGEIQGTIYACLVELRRHRRLGGWWLGTEVLVELSPYEVYRPDIAGWRIDRAPERPSGWPVRIAPDWVCEILSPATASRDLGHKQRNYHLAGVGHYWVVEPVQRTLAVYRWHEAEYVRVLTAGADELVRAEPFEAIELDIADIFGQPPRAR